MFLKIVKTSSSQTISVFRTKRFLKIARTKSGNPTEDTYIDMVGYSAIAGELCEDNKEHGNK